MAARKAFGRNTKEPYERTLLSVKNSPDGHRPRDRRRFVVQRVLNQ